jgi:hypothetical protein
MFNPRRIKSEVVNGFNLVAGLRDVPVPKMRQPRLSPTRVAYFDDWDHVANITFKNGTKGKRYILDEIPAELVGFLIPDMGQTMGRIARSDVGRKLIVDQTADGLTVAYIE